MLVGEWSAGKEILSRKSIWSMGTSKCKGPELSLIGNDSGISWVTEQKGGRENVQTNVRIGAFTCVYIQLIT